MEPMDSLNPKAEVDKLLKRLHDPLQLRVFATVVMLAIGYVGIYMPLGGRIDDMTRRIDADKKRQTLARDVEQLRAEVEKFQGRLPENTDTNEWVQYVLGGIRKFPLKLNRLDSDPSRRVGPYEAVVLHVDVVGRFGDLDSFLHWLETNERMFYVESAKIVPKRNESEGLSMQLVLLGAKA